MKIRENFHEKLLNTIKFNKLAINKRSHFYALVGIFNNLTFTRCSMNHVKKHNNTDILLYKSHGGRIGFANPLLKLNECFITKFESLFMIDESENFLLWVSKWTENFIWNYN